VPVFTATVYVVIFGKFAKFPNGNIAYPILVYSGCSPDAVLHLRAHPFPASVSSPTPTS
jgi:hypothetical protein